MTKNIMKHEIGPYKIIDGDISNDSTLINEPAILFDKETLMLYKIGNFNTVNNMYTKRITRLSRKRASDLLVIKFNHDILSKDDICTIFNTMLNCADHPMLQYIANNDTEKIKAELTKLQRIGY